VIVLCSLCVKKGVDEGGTKAIINVGVVGKRTGQDQDKARRRHY